MALHPTESIAVNSSSNFLELPVYQILHVLISLAHSKVIMILHSLVPGLLIGGRGGRPGDEARSCMTLQTITMSNEVYDVCWEYLLAYAR